RAGARNGARGNTRRQRRAPRRRPRARSTAAANRPPSGLAIEARASSARKTKSRSSSLLILMRFEAGEMRAAVAARCGREIGSTRCASLPVVAHEVFRADLGSVDDRAAADRSDAFRAAAAALRRRIRDEVLHDAVLRAADPDAALPAGMREVQAFAR